LRTSTHLKHLIVIDYGNQRTIANSLRFHLYLYLLSLLYLSIVYLDFQWFTGCPNSISRMLYVT